MKSAGQLEALQCENSEKLGTGLRNVMQFDTGRRFKLVVRETFLVRYSEWCMINNLP